ncbi:MAG: Fe-Mn family superoxide dismutase [Patescibacteria group bacterium]
MAYEAKNYDHLIGTPGFSETLLKNHFTLYQGYVKNVNTLLEKLRAGDPATPEYAEMQRRLGWEFNGMRLHELYFQNMMQNSPGCDKDAPLCKQMDVDFGPEEKSWTKNFKAIAAMRGIGWVILYWDPIGERLVNTWINEHDVGHLAGCFPLVVMDVFEHAYMTDYGIKRADYIEAFMKSIDWSVVYERFTQAKI